MVTRFEHGNAQDFVKEGSWFRDAQGRYVLLRGINFASRSKLPPYLPILPLNAKELNQEGIYQFYQELKAIEPELDLLKQLGLNVVRLLVMWKAIEPRPNLLLEQLLPEGKQYLSLVKEVVDALYLRGLFTIIDFHQDIAHEVYGGDGFPDWALAIDQNHQRPPQSDLKNTRWELEYYGTILTKNHELVRYTLQSFWHNNLTNTEAALYNFPVRTHFEKVIGQTAGFFNDLSKGQGYPGILGYEPFNEPFPVGIDKREFESQILSVFYSNVLREIRSTGDTRSYLFVEPQFDWHDYPADAPEFDLLNFTLKPETFLDVSGIQQERVVFSFHYYDPWTFLYAATPGIADNMYNKQREWPDVFRRMCDAGISRGLIPFLTEFGGSQDWHFLIDTDLRPSIYHHKQIRAYMDLLFQQVEGRLLNATYWNFDLYNTVESGDNWNLENFSLLGPERSPRHLDIVARPYPMRSSAEPCLLSFDLETKHCTLILQGPVIDAPTVIYIPRIVHYVGGFEVRATSPGLEWDEENQLLYWFPDGSQLLNQIIISPADAFDSDSLPKESQTLLPRTSLRTVHRIGEGETVDIQHEQASVDTFGEKALIFDTWVSVKESDADVDTGIDIEPQDEYAFEASGEIWAGVLFTGKNGPNGWNNVDHNTKFPLHTGPDAYPFCLLGKLGSDGPYFFIGEQKLRESYSGQEICRLYLRINDDLPGNGNGEFTCRIRLWR